MDNHKYLIKNKRKFKSIFRQVRYCSEELINVIKAKNIKEIYIIANAREESLAAATNHYEFYLSIESDEYKILEMIVKNLKVDIPFNEDAAWKINNLKDFCMDHGKFIKAELERYLKKHNIDHVQINIKNSFNI